MTEKVTSTEFAKSLKGFDYIAVRNQFGKDLTALGEIEATFALAFLVKRRDGLADGAAFDAAMNLTMSDIESLFEPEADPLDEDSESGKGSAPE